MSIPPTRLPLTGRAESSAKDRPSVPVPPPSASPFRGDGRPQVERLP